MPSANEIPTFFTGLRVQPSTVNNAVTGIVIDQDNNNISIDIDSEQTTTDIINVSAAVLTTGKALDIPDLDALTTGVGVNIVANSSNTGAFTLLNLKNDHASATGASLLTALNDSTGTSITIDHNGITGKSLYIDAESTTETAGVVDIAATVLTTGTAIDIGDLDALTTGIGINVVSNSANTGAFTLLNLKNDHASATGASLLTALNDSTGTSITIDHNGITGKSLYIDAESTTETAGVVDIAATVLTTGTAIDIGDLDALTTGIGINVVSNSANTGISTLVRLHNDHATATARIPLNCIQDAISSSITTGLSAQFTNRQAGAIGCVIKLYHQSGTSGGGDNDVSGRILFTADDEIASQTEMKLGQIDMLMIDATIASYASQMDFYCATAGAENKVGHFTGAGELHIDLSSGAGTATVFDDEPDIEIINQWNLDPESRDRFLTRLEGLGITSRKDTGSGWMMCVQKGIFLTWGAINQMTRWITGLEDRLSVVETRMQALPA